MEKSAVFNNRLLPYLLLIPQLIITFVFFYWPASQAIWQSFLREDAFGLTSEFVGFENYAHLFGQPEYYKSMVTTVVFSTHVMPHAEELCDHVVMIHKGRKVIDDPVGLQAPRCRFRSIG